MLTVRLIVVAATIALASPVIPTSHASDQYTTPGHSGDGSSDSSSGTLASIADSATSRSAESSSISLNSIASSPAHYNGKTLARRVSLGGTRNSAGAIAVAAQDSETGARLGNDPDGGFTLVMTKKLANRLGSSKDSDAIVTFTVTKIPIPGRPTWIGVVTRVQLLAQNGSVSETLDAD